MAQIKKFKAGDKVTKTGKLIWNGKELTPEQYESFRTWAAENSEKVGNVASDMIAAVDNGRTITFDPVKRTVTGLSSVDEYSPRANMRASKSRLSRIGKGLDVLANSDRKQLANQIWEVGEWSPSSAVTPSTTVNPTTPSTKKTLAFIDRTMDYNTTADNRYMDTSNNAAIMAILDQYNDYLKDADRVNNWTVTGNEARRKEIDAFYLANPGKLNEYRSQLRSGILDPVTIQNLKNDLLINASNYSKSPEEVAEVAEEQAEQIQAIEQDASLLNPDAWNGHGITWGLDEDGNLIAKGYVKDMMYHLNGFSPVNTQSKYYNGFMLNGKLYTEDEFRNNSDLIERWKSAAELIRNQDWDRLRLSNTAQYLWGKDPFNKYDATREYADIGVVLPNGTSYYNLYNQWDVPEGWHALGYIDPNAEADPLTGIQSAQYVLYNPLTGETIQSDFNKNPLKKRLNPWQEGQVDYQAAPVNPYVTYNGHNYSKVRDYYKNEGDEQPLYSFYRNATDGNIYMQQDGEFHLVNPELYNKTRQKGYVYQDQDFENMIRGKFKHLKNGKYRRTDMTIPETLNPAWGALTYWFRNKENAPYGKVQGSENGGKLFKDGGTLKLQYGGHTGETTKKGANSKTINATVDDYRKEDAKGTGFLQFKEGSLTDADKMELAAIAADVIGTGVSFIPGANVAGAITGMGATGLQFASDVKRDGLDWGDAIYGLGSLGLDALTLVPFAGGAAKGIKTARAIQKSAKAIGAAFTAYGISEGADGLKNIVNGDWDISDVRKVAAGLQGLVGSGRIIANKIGNAKFAADVAKSAKTATAPKLKGTIKVGDKDLEFTLSNKDITDAKISGKYNKGNDENIKHLLEDKIKAAAKEANIELPKDFESTILNNVKIDGKPLDIKSKFGLFGKESYVLDTPKAEKVGNLSKDWRKNLFKNLDWSLTGKSQLSKYGDLSEVVPSTKLAAKAKQQMTVWNPERFGMSVNNSKVRPTNKLFTHGPLSMYERIAPVRVDAKPFIDQMNMARVFASTPTIRTLSKQTSFAFPENWNGSLRGLSSIPEPGPMPIPDLPPIQSLIKQRPNIFKPQLSLSTGQTGVNLPTIRPTGKVLAYSTEIADKNLPFIERLPSTYRWFYDIPEWAIVKPAPIGLPPAKSMLALPPARTLELPTAQRLMLPEQGTINILGFKKGGSIIKAQRGDIIDPIPDMSKYSNLGWQKFSEQADPIKRGAAKISAEIEKRMKDNQLIGEKPKSINLDNWFDPTIRAIKFATANAFNNRVHKVQEKAIRDAGRAAMQIMPTEIYSTFKTNGITHELNNAVNKQRQMKFVGTDWTAVAAAQHAANTQADMLNVDAAKSVSQAWDQWQDKQDQLRRSYALQRAETANKNRQITASVISKLGENESSKLQNRAQSWANLFGELQGLHAQDKQIEQAKRQALFDQIIGNKTRAKRNEYLQSRNLQAQFDALGENGIKTYGNVLNWMQSQRPTEYQEYLKIQGDVTNDELSQLYDPQKSFLSKWFKV